MNGVQSTRITAQIAHRVRGLAGRCVRYLGIWSIVVVLFAAQWYTHDALLGRLWPLENYLRWSAVEWYTWAALAPFVFRITARYPIDLPLRPRVIGAHLVASVAVTLVAVIGGAIIAHLLEPGSLDEQFAQFFSKHVAMGFITYWALVTLRQALHFQREKTRRELETSRLAAELAQSRLQVLKTQLQPHFLFNTLHAIVTLLNEDPAAAEDMLLRLSDLLRAFLEDYQGQEIPLGRELAVLDLYLGIQRIRFKDRLTIDVSVVPETLDCAVPSLILQPLVENAIQHGIGKNVGSDRIDITACREADSLCIEVRNRNSSLDKSLDVLSRRGIGLTNSRLRLKELYGDSAQIRLDPLWPDGVACRLRIPFHLFSSRVADVQNVA